MAKRPNLADPQYEPTDLELAGLMHRAFADVLAKRERGLAEIRGQIAAGQRAARERLPELLAKSR